MANGQVDTSSLLGPIKIAVTATYEVDTNLESNTNMTRHIGRSIRFTSASLLNLMSNTVNMSFKGYELDSDQAGDIVIATNRQTGGVQDVSFMLSWQQPDEWIETGIENSSNGSFSLASFGCMSLWFDDANGTSFYLYGMAKSSSASGPTSTANTKESFSFTLTAAGEGTVFSPIDGGPVNAVFSGTVSVGASATVPE